MGKTFSATLPVVAFMYAAACSSDSFDDRSGAVTPPPIAAQARPQPQASPSPTPLPEAQPQPNNEDVLYLAGSPSEIAQAHAAALAVDMKLLVNEWLLPKVNQFGALGEAFLNLRIRSLEANIPAPYLAEMNALATESGISFRNLLIANSAADIMQLISERNLFGCSTIAVAGSRSKTGGMIVGRNLDYADSDSLRGRWKPVVFAAPGKLKILSLHVPGLSGVLTGINEKGVFLAVKVSKGETTWEGTPSAFIFRQVLEEAQSAQQAVDLYKERKSTIALNVSIVDANVAYELEIDAERYAVRSKNSSGILYGANHFEAASMDGDSADRDQRWPILSRFDNSQTKVGLEDVRKALAEAGGFDEDPSTNVLAVLVDYQNKIIYYGSDVDGKKKAADTNLQKIDLGQVFATP